MERPWKWKVSDFPSEKAYIEARYVGQSPDQHKHALEMKELTREKQTLQSNISDFKYMTKQANRDINQIVAPSLNSTSNQMMGRPSGNLPDQVMSQLVSDGVTYTEPKKEFSAAKKVAIANQLAEDHAKSKEKLKKVKEEEGVVDISSDEEHKLEQALKKRTMEEELKAKKLRRRVRQAAEDRRVELEEKKLAVAAAEQRARFVEADNLRNPESQRDYIMIDSPEPPKRKPVPRREPGLGRPEPEIVDLVESEDELCLAMKESKQMYSMEEDQRKAYKAQLQHVLDLGGSGDHPAPSCSNTQQKLKFTRGPDGLRVDRNTSPHLLLPVLGPTTEELLNADLSDADTKMWRTGKEEGRGKGGSKSKVKKSSKPEKPDRKKTVTKPLQLKNFVKTYSVAAPVRRIVATPLGEATGETGIRNGEDPTDAELKMLSDIREARKNSEVGKKSKKPRAPSPPRSKEGKLKAQEKAAMKEMAKLEREEGERRDYDSSDFYDSDMLSQDEEHSEDSAQEEITEIFKSLDDNAELDKMLKASNALSREEVTKQLWNAQYKQHKNSKRNRKPRKTDDDLGKFRTADEADRVADKKLNGKKVPRREYQYNLKSKWICDDDPNSIAEYRTYERLRNKMHKNGIGIGDVIYSRKDPLKQMLLHDAIDDLRKTYQPTLRDANLKLLQNDMLKRESNAESNEKFAKFNPKRVRNTGLRSIMYDGRKRNLKHFKSYGSSSEDNGSGEDEATREEADKLKERSQREYRIKSDDSASDEGEPYLDSNSESDGDNGPRKIGSVTYSSSDNDEGRNGGDEPVLSDSGSDVVLSDSNGTVVGTKKPKINNFMADSDSEFDYRPEDDPYFWTKHDPANFPEDMVLDISKKRPPSGDGDQEKKRMHDSSSSSKKRPPSGDGDQEKEKKRRHDKKQEASSSKRMRDSDDENSEEERGRKKRDQEESNRKRKDSSSDKPRRKSRSRSRSKSPSIFTGGLYHFLTPKQKLLENDKHYKSKQKSSAPKAPVPEPASKAPVPASVSKERPPVPKERAPVTEVPFTTEAPVRARLTLPIPTKKPRPEKAGGSGPPKAGGSGDPSSKKNKKRTLPATCGGPPKLKLRDDDSNQNKPYPEYIHEAIRQLYYGTDAYPLKPKTKTRKYEDIPPILEVMFPGDRIPKKSTISRTILKHLKGEKLIKAAEKLRRERCKDKKKTTADEATTALLAAKKEAKKAKKEASESNGRIKSLQSHNDGLRRAIKHNKNKDPVNIGKGPRTGETDSGSDSESGHGSGSELYSSSADSDPESDMKIGEFSITTESSPEYTINYSSEGELNLEYD